MGRYCKRLIESDLPIRQISQNATSEGHHRGHISTLHKWWARRPLAACRSVLCGMLWPDPVDENCPPLFREKARLLMQTWVCEPLAISGIHNIKNIVMIRQDLDSLNDPRVLRTTLLDFISSFSDKNNSQHTSYLKIARELTKIATETLHARNQAPLVVDPFAGGGAIPLEALRLHAQAFASDLNPVAVLINKVILEILPECSEEIIPYLEKWGRIIFEKTRNQLQGFYGQENDLKSIFAYIWARTVKCEGPNCGTTVPMLRDLWIDKSKKSRFGLKLSSKGPGTEISINILENPHQQKDATGTNRRSSATCPACHYTTPRKAIERQARTIGLGQKLIAIAIDYGGKRYYREPTKDDEERLNKAEKHFRQLRMKMDIPSEDLPYLRSIFNVHVYGIDKWHKLFSERQLLFLSTLMKHVGTLDTESTGLPDNLYRAIKTLLAFNIDRAAMHNCNIARWRNDKGGVEGAFGAQDLRMVWDWAELQPFYESNSSFMEGIEIIKSVIKNMSSILDKPGVVEQSSATDIPLPDDSASVIFTDPPYYDSIPYANLSDFFYVWLKRTVGDIYPYFMKNESPKKQEIVQLAERNKIYSYKTKEYFIDQMTEAMREARRVCEPGGIGCVVFAHKTTEGWEALLESVINGGWVITASWPIETELSTRFKAIGTASLSSSIHLICRPRENPDGTLRNDDIGDWRDVLAKLPERIHDWLPRLAEEGVVGADAIFACLGPALEIFSWYSSVEKASGEQVSLKEFLIEVWAAVSREALNMIFEGADATGFEEDARLTAIWLWTLRTSINGDDKKEVEDEKTSSLRGYALEYDAARKIAQGLGVHLENLRNLVEIKGGTAMLLSAGARTKYLFGKDSSEAPKRKERKKPEQMSLDFGGEIKELEEQTGDWAVELSARVGRTVLDQLHQCMILFGAGRGEAFRRFLVEEGVGQNPLLWRLAQSLSALYPQGTDEKRWVDGVLARKKGLGF